MSGLELADIYKPDAYQQVDQQTRGQLGQFFTNATVASFMAALFHDPPEHMRVLDAGAGVGILSAALVQEMCNRRAVPKSIHVTLYESETRFHRYMRNVMAECENQCTGVGIQFGYELRQVDFIESGVEILQQGLFRNTADTFNYAILNPPYRKITSQSFHRKMLRRVDIEASNLYTGFLALVIELLEPNGQLVAITPRSFCNGSYFRRFRQFFLNRMSFMRIHEFTTRDKAFGEDDVLQENIVFHALKRTDHGEVTISSSNGPNDEFLTLRSVRHEQIINPRDPNLFIHIATNEADQQVADQINRFCCTLDDLNAEVSTGRVVDFRAREHLRDNPDENTVPLIYPTHMRDGFIDWPLAGGRKPNAIVATPETENLLLPRGTYVVVRRFSSKEERRRLVAAVYDSEHIPAERVGFENHLNVFHFGDNGLEPAFARGLAVFLNSTLLDLYFRQFNGHTQVNATDLRSLRYPERSVLCQFGQDIENQVGNQDAVDELLAKELSQMAGGEGSKAVAMRCRIEEALEIIKSLGLPRGQQNDRSAMTLLALVGLTSDQEWSSASAPLMGITPIMEFISEHYGVSYAPNTRETIRRQTMHQFVDAGFAVTNPDRPDRPVNSPQWCYQIEERALLLVRSYGSFNWESELAAYVQDKGSLKKKYARHRQMQMIPVQFSSGQEISLSPGAHSELMKQIVEQFAPRFAPGAQVIYIGDTGDKWGYFDKTLLRELGVSVDLHGKMPDVVMYFPDRKWLLLIEAVTSHGPVDPKRRDELAKLFADAAVGSVYVTAFLTRSDLSKHIASISWATEVWIAESPSHLIHFDGARFLGPYDQ